MKYKIILFTTLFLFLFSNAHSQFLFRSNVSIFKSLSPDYAHYDFGYGGIVKLDYGFESTSITFPVYSISTTVGYLNLSHREENIYMSRVTNNKFFFLSIGGNYYLSDLFIIPYILADISLIALNKKYKRVEPHRYYESENSDYFLGFNMGFGLVYELSNLLSIDSSIQYTLTSRFGPDEIDYSLLKFNIGIGVFISR